MIMKMICPFNIRRDLADWLGLFFWGCPALWAGRAVPQLAARSALQRFQRFGLALRATAIHPSARFNCAALAIVCYEFLARLAIF